MHEKSRHDRSFEMVTAADPTDQFHRVRIRCSARDCDRTMIYSRRGAINPIAAAKWFRDKGWGVGGHQRADRCPEHWRGEDMGKRANGGANIKTKHTDIRTDTAIPPPVTFDDMKISTGNLHASTEQIMPEAPVSLSMSRADKRIIYNKLDEVYADETTGYRGHWNDEKVATDLGVPKEWVAAIREDTFGPEINREKEKAEVDRLVREIMDRSMTYNTSLMEVQLKIEEYGKLSETLDKKLDDFETKVAAMTALFAQFDEAVKELKA
jgi:hypothetical protein